MSQAAREFLKTAAAHKQASGEALRAGNHKDAASHSYNAERLEEKAFAVLAAEQDRNAVAPEKIERAKHTIAKAICTGNIEGGYDTFEAFNLLAALIGKHERALRDPADPAARQLEVAINTAIDGLSSFLLNNTDQVFEEIEEIDEVRSGLQDALHVFHHGYAMGEKPEAAR